MRGCTSRCCDYWREIRRGEWRSPSWTHRNRRNLFPKGRAPLAPTHASIENRGLRDGDAVAVQADVVAARRGQQLNTADAEVAQDLGADADLAPLRLALRAGGRGGAIGCLPLRRLHVALGGTEIDDDAGAAAADRVEGARHEPLVAGHDGGEGILEDALAVDAHGHWLAPEITDAERDMPDVVGGRGIDDALRCGEAEIHIQRVDARHQLLEALPVLDEVGDRDDAQAVGLG